MNTALVVMDVQNCFLNKNTKYLPKMILKYIKLNKFDFVLFTKFINKKDSNFFKTLKWKKCMASPAIDIAPNFQKYLTKFNTFNKTSYSIFKSKKFIKFLKQNEISKLYLCGIDIDACILASAFEGFDLGYSIKILNKLSISSAGKKFDSSAALIIKRNLQK